MFELNICNTDKEKLYFNCNLALVAAKLFCYHVLV